MIKYLIFSLLNHTNFDKSEKGLAAAISCMDKGFFFSLN